MNALAEGKKVLAIDAVGDGGLETILHQGWDPDDHPEVLRLTPDHALNEYLRIFLHLPIAPNRIGPLARIFDYVATAAPGVREVLVLGKIASEVRDGGWDAVVVDAPATGHAVELLNAADTLTEMIRVGPIVSQTRWIGDLIGDPARTTVIAVTLAEELPVTECLELLERLEAEARVDVSGVIINRTPTILTRGGRLQAERAGDELSAIAVARSDEADLQLARFDDQGLPLLIVPPAPSGVRAITQLRHALTEWH